MILCSGKFDGLHSGHVAYLQAAASLGEESLLVSVAPDAYIRAASGRNPSWSQPLRKAAVEALRCVDVAYEDPEHTPAALIRNEKPRLFVKGVEWAGKLPADVVAACREVGCLMVFVDTPGKHTSETR